MNKKAYTQPCKLIPYFEKLKEVYSEIESVVLTDEEVHALVNSKLKPEERVHKKTADAWRGNGRDCVENIESLPDKVKLEYRDFINTVRAIQKMKLTKDSLDPENKGAYKQHWLLERKFPELRLNTGISISPTIQISAGDSEGKKLIEGILKGEETIDVEHEEVNE